jgi:hypothetical protein
VESWARVKEERGQGPGGEPLWIAPKKPHDVSLGARMTARLFEQAAPANVSTRVGFLRFFPDEEFLSGTMGKNIACDNSREPLV